MQRTISQLNMSSTIRNILFIFGIVCVVIMVIHFDADGRGASMFLSSVWPWMPIVLAIWIPIYAFNALAYKTIVNLTAPTSASPRIKYVEAARLTISGFAFSYITPMGFGGLPYRIMELRQRLGTTRATASTLLYSMTHVLSHFLLWSTAAILFPVFYSGKMDMTLWLLISCFLLLAVIVFFVFLKGIKSKIALKLLTLFTLIPFIKRFTQHWLLKYSEKAQQIDQSLSMLHRAPLLFLKALACEYIARLINTWEFIFILAAFGHHIAYVDALMILAFSSLIGNIFFFLPLQLGAREGGVISIISLLSLPAVVGVYTAFFTRIREIFWVAIGVILIKFHPKTDNND